MAISLLATALFCCVACVVILTARGGGMGLCVVYAEILCYGWFGCQIVSKGVGRAGEQESCYIWVKSKRFCINLRRD